MGMGTMKSILFFSLVISFLLSRGNSTSSNSSEIENENGFDYKEESSKGPAYWGEIHPEWRVCRDGKRQSPIDLTESLTVLSKLERIKRNYTPSAAVLKSRGHDIMLKWKEDAGGIVINGTIYYLKQLHWHTPSEHRINGSRYDMELHMLHESNEGRFTVIGILYKLGEPDSFLNKLMHALTLVGLNEEDVGVINPRDIKFVGTDYYRYEGSFTTPPCTEGVIWTLAKKVKTASREQIHALRQAVHDGFEVNARPIQAINDRTVWMASPTQTGLN